MGIEYMLYVSATIILSISAVIVALSARRNNPINPNKQSIYDSGTQGIPQPVNPVDINQLNHKFMLQKLEQLQDTVSETSNTLRIELEIPVNLPKRIRVEPEKALEIIRTLQQGSYKEAEEPGGREFIKPLQGVEPVKGPKQEEKSWSTFKRHYNPLLDIIEKISGLEFSEDGERVYCPRHGWVHYIITSSGDILCGEGHEILWSPNKPRIDKKEILQLQKDLEKIYSEIEELRKQALMETREARAEEYEEEEEEGEEHEGEEYEEEE